jgi:hypothetical protein
MNVVAEKEKTLENTGPQQSVVSNGFGSGALVEKSVRRFVEVTAGAVRRSSRLGHGVYSPLGVAGVKVVPAIAAGLVALTLSDELIRELGASDAIIGGQRLPDHSTYEGRP